MYICVYVFLFFKRCTHTIHHPVTPLPPLFSHKNKFLLKQLFNWSLVLHSQIKNFLSSESPKNARNTKTQHDIHIRHTKSIPEASFVYSQRSIRDQKETWYIVFYCHSICMCAYYVRILCEHLENKILFRAFPRKKRKQEAFSYRTCIKIRPL